MGMVGITNITDHPATETVEIVLPAIVTISSTNITNHPATETDRDSQD